MNLIAMISDGITEKIDGVMRLKDLLKHLEDGYKNKEVSWLRVREAVIFIISLLSYIVAYLGVFVADILIHFSWSILYVVSPLMILMYVSEKTAFVTSSLYRGLINVVTWKILCSILGVLLLKMATVPEVASSDNFLMAVLMNLCIGFCMLFIPSTTKSLLTNGMESVASKLTAVPAVAAAGAIKLYTMKYWKTAAKEPFNNFKGTRSFFSRNYNRAKTGYQTGKKWAEKTQNVATKIRNHSISDSRRVHSPFDKHGPFSKKGRDRFLNGKE